MSNIQSPEGMFPDSFVTPGITGPGDLTDRKTGLVNITLVTSVASTEILWPAINLAVVPAGNAPFVWLAFSSAGDFHIIWGATGVPAPVIGADTSSTPLQQARLIPANFEYMRKCVGGAAPDSYFRMIQDSGSDLAVNIEMVSTPQFDV